ncbi:plasmid SOS inhibition protein A (plasmid) [Edwardsiella tarda]|uniref:plasmid SOS inhibition protein A n=1 Tax=Edwardsiella tarda TaxID=636 RepID=UPI002444A548|nr:plasmid SOS inhibition protein A [Edwardsiella tarda]WGE30925.1 plasmid SOS inhibition protein A [Edwardsiella tarda]WGE31041.1 plasmid SOS inhibition protein A [Edwardsiella tarda]
MMATSQALVPLQADRRAAMQAIADVESRSYRGRGEYPYAQAFFRHLRGVRRITLRELRYFAPVLTERELRGQKDHWLQAIDMLIESRGACCWLPLPVDAGQALFPEVIFRHQERQRRQDSMRDEKYTRQRRKAASLRERSLQALKAQAEIALAFHTPTTLGSWLSHWVDSGVPEYELESMLMRWIQRFPTLSTWYSWPGEPLWRVVDDIAHTARSASSNLQVIDRWLIPNKLTIII